MTDTPSSPREPTREAPMNPVEEAKDQSLYLRGSIREELAQEVDHFDKAASNLLKFHGTYQQDDRDSRAAAKSEGDGKAYMFMVRTRIPGGKLTAQQLLAEIELGDELGNQTLRITSRQGLQLHGIRKHRLQETIRRINASHLSTLGACGDVNRNVMCCPAPFADPWHREIQALADAIADHFASKSGAYEEIWLQEWDDGQLQGEKQRLSSADEHAVEPIYGKHYLPRKFKMGIALPHDNCIDVYTHDVGMIAVPEGDRIGGYNVLVGGGMGVTPSAKKTFPAVGRKLAFVPAERILDVLTAIVKVQRDFGSRADRKVARLKYLIANWGVPAFRAKVEEYLGERLIDPTGVDVSAIDDHMGWAEQGDGNWFYGLNVENGRIKDHERFRLKSALRAICQELQPGIRLTAHQSILFSDVSSDRKSRLESILRDHGVPMSHEISQVRRWSMACVAWPTCGLSITEAERALPAIVDQLEIELQRLGLADEQFTVRMTGCPNGCARPYNSDIGLVGKTKGKYTIFLGGRKLGERLNFLYRDLVPEEDLVRELVPILTYFRESREPGESLGDFCHRSGSAKLLEVRSTCGLS